MIKVQVALSTKKPTETFKIAELWGGTAQQYAGEKMITKHLWHFYLYPAEEVNIFQQLLPNEETLSI